MISKKSNSQNVWQEPRLKTLTPCRCYITVCFFFGVYGWEQIGSYLYCSSFKWCPTKYENPFESCEKSQSKGYESWSRQNCPLSGLSNICAAISGGCFFFFLWGGCSVFLIAMMMVDLSGFENAWHNAKPWRNPSNRQTKWYFWKKQAANLFFLQWLC